MKIFLCGFTISLQTITYNTSPKANPLEIERYGLSETVKKIEVDSIRNNNKYNSNFEACSTHFKYPKDACLTNNNGILTLALKV